MHFNECGYWKPPARFLSHMNMPKAYYIGTKPKAQSDCVTILICFNGLIETPSFMLILGLLVLEIHKHSHTCTFVKDVISIFWCNMFSEMKWHFAQQFESVSREEKKERKSRITLRFFSKPTTLCHTSITKIVHTQTHWAMSIEILIPHLCLTELNEDLFVMKRGKYTNESENRPQCILNWKLLCCSWIEYVYGCMQMTVVQNGI